MQVVCPVCATAYTIPSHKLPKRTSLATCSDCGTKITLEPEVVGNLPMQSQPQDHAAATARFRPRHDSAPIPTRAWTMAESGLLGDYPELKNLDPNTFHLDEIFAPTKRGTYKTRINNLKAKVITATRGVLARALQDDEKVMRVAKATAYYPAEAFLGNGFLTMMYNHYAVVGTDRRLLFVNINPRISHPSHYFFQMPYGAIRKVGRGLLGTDLALHPLQGKRRTFTNMKWTVAKEIQEFIRERQKSAAPLPSPGVVPEDLCPSCFTPLGKELASCPSCRAVFKKPETALVKSLLLPGWGDIYLGHKILGVFELIGSVLVWLLVISLLFAGEPEAITLAAVAVTLYNGLDGLLTFHMAKKGYALAAR